ncbi:hypothetical protein COY52_06230 [Candidatus Desantisbacteria bacterium CG_4_10_14_0_8_um_filter_48_22]|uniref:Uncharacterized protein n=1 Tax=Candidatus Desantisbacteria bacterium CG_4_10_14_0_8_um_filter_48_22 TaxID=1974543 RepID=A0A2M7SB81_9BACT|nr:MAG: hypothetical protein COY52_06230 [Candidatus Desantisbacteria bacterium CG_4_10_14_0_8_um_filter_48_22]
MTSPKLEFGIYRLEVKKSSDIKMNKKELKVEIAKLFKSMDYVADRYLSKTKINKKKSELGYNIYQQLGLLWEFLSLQCKHWDGYKKKGDKFLCKICRKVKGIKEKYYLLPVNGGKVIGRMVKPGKDNLRKLSKKEAEIVNDTIKFHGAKLNVAVFKEYASKFGKLDKEINVAADRVVTLEENGLVVDISEYITGIKTKRFKEGGRIYGGFLWELPKKILRKMPIILSYDKSGKLAEIELIHLQKKM